jgi:hypothetical protein
MESSEPARRERFGRSEWPCDGGGASGENILVSTAAECELRTRKGTANDGSNASTEGLRNLSLALFVMHDAKPSTREKFALVEGTPEPYPKFQNTLAPRKLQKQLRCRRGNSCLGPNLLQSLSFGSQWQVLEIQSLAVVSPHLCPAALICEPGADNAHGVKERWNLFYDMSVTVCA